MKEKIIEVRGVKRICRKVLTASLQSISIEFVRRTLLEGKPQIYDVLDRDVVTNLVDEHLRGERNRRLLIWSLLSVEIWMAANL